MEEFVCRYLRSIQVVYLGSKIEFHSVVLGTLVKHSMKIPELWLLGSATTQASKNKLNVEYPRYLDSIFDVDKPQPTLKNRISIALAASPGSCSNTPSSKGPVEFVLLSGSEKFATGYLKTKNDVKN